MTVNCTKTDLRSATYRNWFVRKTVKLLHRIRSRINTNLKFQYLYKNKLKSIKFLKLIKTDF